eukprot:GEMP01003380.1.p1 GENE.GEMP01003380.1~~GEMP01003380.1.p1  ORF type:complete len:909 (+),score=185.14 GEMP01003380.1:38-2764(+)
MAPCSSSSSVALLEAESALALAQEVLLLAPKNVGTMGSGRWELHPAGPSAGTRSAIIVQLRTNYKLLFVRWKELLWPRTIPEAQLDLLGNALCANVANESLAPFRLYVARYGQIDQIVVTAFVEAAMATLPSCSAQMRCVLQTTANFATDAVDSSTPSTDKLRTVMNKLGNTVKASMSLQNIDDERYNERFKVWDKIRTVVDACNQLTSAVREFHVPSSADVSEATPFTKCNLILTTESMEWRMMRQEVARIFLTDYHREAFLKLWDAHKRDGDASDDVRIPSNCFWANKRRLQRNLYDEMVHRIGTETGVQRFLFREMAHRLVDEFSDRQELTRIIRKTELIGTEIFSSIFPWAHHKIVAVRSMWSSVAFEICSEISKETSMRELGAPHQSCLPPSELYQPVTWKPGDDYQPDMVKTVFVGAVINGRYKVTAHIGEGGFGHGWIGTDLTQEGSKVFIKTFLSEDEKKGHTIADRIQMTVLELARTRRLKGCKLMDSPFMVRILDVVINGSVVVPSTGKTSNQFFAVITEFCSGGELFNYVVTKEAVGQSLDVPISRYLFMQLLDMLDALDNAGYVHGDIKLENILVEEGHRIKLIDYGTLRNRANVYEDEVTATEFNHQTPQYRHPFFSSAEKHMKYHRSVREICRALDVWACGLVLWHLLTIGEVGEQYGFDALQVKRYDVTQAAVGLELDPITMDFLSRIFCRIHQTPTVEELREHPWCKEPCPRALHVKGVLVNRFLGIEQAAGDRGVCLVRIPPCENEFHCAKALLVAACKLRDKNWSVRHEDKVFLVECWDNMYGGKRTSSFETNESRSHWLVGSIFVTLVDGNMRLRWEHGSSLEEFLTYQRIVKELADNYPNGSLGSIEILERLSRTTIMKYSDTVRSGSPSSRVTDGARTPRLSSFPEE